MSAPAVKIAAQLGGPRVLRRAVTTELELVAAVRDGFPAGTVAALARNAELTNEDVFRLILPKRTLADRKAKRARLSTAESERVARLARIFSQALDTFQNTEKARRWLRRPSRPLGGRPPLDLLDTEAGARLVEDELTRISYGVYA